MNKILDAAIRAVEMDMNPIPIVPNIEKKALVKWGVYKDKKITKDQVYDWWARYPNANWANINGHISRNYTLDVDTPEAHKALLDYDPSLKPNTYTPNRGGYHFHFTSEENLDSKVLLIDGNEVEFKGYGSYIMMPPSLLECGEYESLDKIDRNNSIPTSILDIYNRELDKAVTGSYGALRNVTFSLERGNRDDSLFHAANCLFKGGMRPVNVRKVLEVLAKSCTPPFSEEERDVKILSALSRLEDKRQNLADEIRDWIVTQSVTLTYENCDRELQIVTKRDKANRRQIFKRLEDVEKLIVKDGDAYGRFRRVLSDGEVQKIDLFSEEDDVDLDLKFPLGIDSMFYANPKNIIVVAGSPDSGKTTFAMEFARMNSKAPQTKKYFSSEMGRQEMKKRIVGGGKDLEDWKGIEIEELSSRMVDRVDPDGINIIDYLEINDNFFLVGQELRAIHDKLNNGIALVCLQKDPDKKYGRGGSFSAEKARLYIALTNNPPEGTVAEIVKCKNWKNLRDNPNGKKCVFDVVNGLDFNMTMSWR